MEGLAEGALPLGSPFSRCAAGSRSPKIHRMPGKRWSFTLARLLAGAGMVMVLSCLLWAGRRRLLDFFASDAVQVIAYSVSELYRKNPAATAEDVEGRILSLHEASVINLKVDDRGNAVDPFGTAFRVIYERVGPLLVITVTSAGADRRFGTRDDISFTDRTPEEPR